VSGGPSSERPPIQGIFPDRCNQVDLAEAYAIPRPRMGSSVHLRANFVTGLDGATTIAGRSGPLSGPADRAVFSTLRSLCDVILVGATTVRQEGYGPARPSEARQALRRRLGLAGVPPIAVVTRSLQLDLNSPLFTQASVRPILLTTEAASPERKESASLRAEVIEAGVATVDPHKALAALAAKGLTRVLCEGGPTLFGHLLAAARVDELCLSVSPMIAGQTSHHLVAPPPEDARWPLGFELVHVLTDGASLFLRYSRPGP
jgi:riboflavin biosynthesis pyrimidine reductase